RNSPGLNVRKSQENIAEHYSISLPSRQSVPTHGLLVILRDTMAVAIEITKGILCIGHSLLSRHTEPSNDILVALPKSMAASIACPEGTLRSGISLLSRHTVPPRGLLIVFRDTLADRVGPAHQPLVNCIAFLRLHDQRLHPLRSRRGRLAPKESRQNKN